MTAKGESARRVLPRPNWFTSVVAKHELSHLLASRHGTTSKEHESKCVVIASIAPGREYHGPLTMWTKEELLLWEHVGRPRDAFSVNIRAAVFLDPGLNVRNPQRKKVPLWVPGVPLDVQNMQARQIPVYGDANRIDKTLVLETLGVSDAELRSFGEDPICLAVPAVLVELVKHKDWEALVLQGRWVETLQRQPAFKRFVQELGLPRQMWLAQLQQLEQLRGFVPQPGSHFQFTPAFAEALALELCSLFDGRLDCKLEGDQTKFRMFMEETVLRLRHFSAQQSTPQFTNAKIDPNAIVKACLAAMNLRDRSQLGETFKLAFESRFPGQSLDAYENTKLLSAATISRKQIEVDAAYCCFWRQHLSAHKGPIYVWADASPQAGSDWLLSIISLIQDCDLPACVNAATSLASSVRAFRQALAMDDKEEMVRLARKRHQDGEFLQEAMQSHRQVPIAIGSRASSIDYKLRAVCRKFWVEAQSTPLLESLLGSVRGFCTDLGTEMSLADVSGIKLESILPAWISDYGLQSEEGANAALTDFVFPNAVFCPGVLHVCHNMSLEADSSLTFWKAWLPGYKAVSTLLHHDHLRKQLIGLCIKGTPFEWMEDLFAQGVPRPATWRWNTVANSLPTILSRKHALQTVWDQSRFQGSGRLLAMFMCFN